MIFDLRTHVHKAILRLFPEPEASLLSGILLGKESGIPPDLLEAYNRTGTTHIIAISGFKRLILDMLIEVSCYPTGQRCDTYSQTDS
jgi:competence protein ComEC